MSQLAMFSNSPVKASSVIGTAVGLLLGYGFGWVAISIFSVVGRQFLNIQVDAPAVSLGLVMISIALGGGVTLWAGLLPARRASQARATIRLGVPLRPSCESRHRSGRSCSSATGGRLGHRGLPAGLVLERVQASAYHGRW